MTDTMPQPGDGPDYHNDLSAWKVREYNRGFEAGKAVQSIIGELMRYPNDPRTELVEASYLPYLREELYQLKHGHEFFVSGFVDNGSTARIIISRR